MAFPNASSGRAAPAHSGLDRVIMRAAIDPEFRTRLLASPRRAIEAEFGIELPAALRLRFCEKDPDVDIHIVLPELTDCPATLADSEMDGVSAGVESPSADHWLLRVCGTDDRPFPPR